MAKIAQMQDFVHEKWSNDIKHLETAWAALQTATADLQNRGAVFALQTANAELQTVFADLKTAFFGVSGPQAAFEDLNSNLWNFQMQIRG